MVRRFINVKSFVFTPTVGQPITFLGCQSISLNVNAEVVKGAGDGDRGPSSIDVVSEEPMVGLKFEDPEPTALNGLSGKRGKVVALVGLSGADKDDNTSGLKITLDPAVAAVKGISGSYKKYSDADVEFHGYWGNGTNPLTLETVLPQGS